MIYHDCLFFDIETAGKYPTLEIYKEKDLRGHDLFVKLYKKRHGENAKGWGSDTPEEAFLKQCGFHSEYGIVICMSFGIIQGNELRVKSLIGDEAQMIKKAASVFADASKKNKFLCGYGIKGFDIPYLIKKFYQYGVEIPSCVNLFNKKSWDIKMYELADIWNSGRHASWAGLDEVAYLLNVETSKGVIDGSQTHDYFWNKGEIETIKTYCEADVRVAYEVFRKMVDCLPHDFVPFKNY